MIQSGEKLQILNLVPHHNLHRNDDDHHDHHHCQHFHSLWGILYPIKSVHSIHSCRKAGRGTFAASAALKPCLSLYVVLSSRMHALVAALVWELDAGTGNNDDASRPRELRRILRRKKSELAPAEEKASKQQTRQAGHTESTTPARPVFGDGVFLLEREEKEDGN